MSYRNSAEQPPRQFDRVTDRAIRRIDEIFEVDPGLMTDHVPQQHMRAWDTRRIARSRTDHLEWMHRHWAAVTVSGARLLAELDAEPPAADHATAPTGDLS